VQAEARAFGLNSLRWADRMLVGLGALTLLPEPADGQPLLCLIDDVDCWISRRGTRSGSLPVGF
jgi:hypothetical protein